MKQLLHGVVCILFVATLFSCDAIHNSRKDYYDNYCSNDFFGKKSSEIPHAYKLENWYCRNDKPLCDASTAGILVFYNPKKEFFAFVHYAESGRYSFCYTSPKQIDF